MTATVSVAVSLNQNTEDSPVPRITHTDLPPRIFKKVALCEYIKNLKRGVYERV